MKKVLTIAGSDSSGGAGIQADLRTFQALGVYGATAITAVTAQNAKRVAAVFPLPAMLVGKQIDAVMEDDTVEVWKTGMLANADIIKIVAQKAKQYRVKALVVDPVLVASSGRRLLAKKAESVLIRQLFPLATVVTPNIPEAEALTNMQIQTVKDMKRAAVLLHKTGAKNVVVKGGHLFDSCHAELVSASRHPHKEIPKRVRDDMLEAIDILYDGKRFYEFSGPYINAVNTHGTGCTFSAAIAAELAKGSNVEKAVENAKKYVAEMINSLKSRI